MFTPSERRLGWRISLVESTFQGVAGALIASTSPYLVPFALFLGASAWEIGLLSAIGPLAMVATVTLDQVPWPRKSIAVWGSAMSRYLWLAIAALPFLPLSGRTPVLAFLGLYALSALLAQAGAVAWLDWMRDLIEPASRGRFFACRNAMATALALATVWLGSIWLDAHKATGDQRSGFLTLILTGVLFAVFGRWALARQPDRPKVAIIQNASERPSGQWNEFIGFLGVWTLVVGLAGPFYAAYAIQHLQMSYQELAAWTMLGSLTALIAQPLWGRLLDRGGRPQAMILCGLIVSAMPLLWIMARPDQLGYVWLDGILNGIAWSGFNLSITHLLLQLCPSGDHRRGLGLYTGVCGLTSGASALLGGCLVGLDIGLPLAGPPLLFLLTSLGRIGCWIWLCSLIHRWETQAAPLNPSPAPTTG